MAGIKYDGIDIPYTSVSTSFSRSPADFVYTDTPRYSGGSRLSRFRQDHINDSIPVKVSRRDTNKTWDQIKTEINAVLFMHKDFKPLAFSFEGEDSSKYYLARMIGIKYSDEKEYTADAEIKFTCEFPYRFGNEVTESITATKTNKVIKGQIPIHWKVISTFTANKETYEFEADGGSVKLTYPFKAGDVLEIDYMERSILLNGADKAVSINLETRWPKIEPGPDSFRADNPSQLKYNELYY